MLKLGHFKRLRLKNAILMVFLSRSQLFEMCFIFVGSNMNIMIKCVTTNIIHRHKTEKYMACMYT